MSASQLPMLGVERSQADTTRHIIDALCDHYKSDHWLTWVELRTATGWRGADQERIDVFAMHTWPSERLVRLAFEVKASRGDFRRELTDPRKRRLALLYFNQFYFATPPGLVRVEEVPPDAGLVEVQDDGFLVWQVTAPWRDSMPPSWLFLAAAVRQARNVARFEGERLGHEAGMRSARERLARGEGL